MESFATLFSVSLRHGVQGRSADHVHEYSSQDQPSAEERRRHRQGRGHTQDGFDRPGQGYVCHRILLSAGDLEWRNLGGENDHHGTKAVDCRLHQGTLRDCVAFGRHCCFPNAVASNASQCAPPRCSGEGAGLARRACSGTRVDAAIHRIALGKDERPKGARLRPARVTMIRESNVASDMPRLS